MSAIRVDNIGFNYGKREVLKGVSLELREGEILSLLGPNGTGKSTLIKLILGLLKPKFGAAYVQEKQVDKYTAKELAKTIAYVPQSSNVAFAFSALDVVLMGRISRQSWFSNPSQEDKDAAIWAMERLGIAHLANRAFPTMSGGEKQLTLIARALSQEAKVLVMDEPVSGLDYGNQLRLLETILSLSNEGYAFLKSTHFPEHAMIVGGRTIAIRDGIVIGEGDSKETVTNTLIDALYDTKVQIKSTECGYSACVPEFFSNQRMFHDR